MPTLRVDTFENAAQKPVLTHLFHGDSRAQALALLRAHMRFDSFLKASLTTQRFGNMRVHSTQTWT